MSDSSTTTRRRFAAYCMFIALLGFLATQATVEANSVDDFWSATPASCESSNDVYRLDVPGTYSVFVRQSSTLASTEVRSSHGEILASSQAGIASTAAVDLLTGVRFGLTPLPVFDIETSVLIQVEHHNSPYELVIVRLDDSQEWSRLDVRPPVTSVINESGSCLIGDLRETLEIHTDGVNSQDGARQVFLVASPSPTRVASVRSDVAG
jgi:hypothetical protein